jgi:hypothetical protein
MEAEEVQAYSGKGPMAHLVQILQVDTILATAAVVVHVVVGPLVDILVVAGLLLGRVAAAAHWPTSTTIQ